LIASTAAFESLPARAGALKPKIDIANVNAQAVTFSSDFRISLIVSSMVRQLGGFRGVNCELQIEENVEEVEPAIYRRLETSKRKTRDARWDAYQVAQGDRMDQHTTHLLAITRSLQLCQRDIKFLELHLCKSVCSRATRRRFPSSREDSAGRRRHRAYCYAGWNGVWGLALCHDLYRTVAILQS